MGRHLAGEAPDTRHLKVKPAAACSTEPPHCTAAGWKMDARSSKNNEDSPHGRQARWQRVATAANKQSLRCGLTASSVDDSRSHIHLPCLIVPSRCCGSDAETAAGNRYCRACAMHRAHGLLLQPQTPLAGFVPQVTAARLALVAVAGAPELLSAPEAAAALADLRCILRMVCAL